MIRGGVPLAELDEYLQRRAWVHDAARQLRRKPEEFAAELVSGMRNSGAVQDSDGRLRAAAEYQPVDQKLLNEPWPGEWPRVERE